MHIVLFSHVNIPIMGDGLDTSKKVSIIGHGFSNPIKRCKNSVHHESVHHESVHHGTKPYL